MSTAQIHDKRDPTALKQHDERHPKLTVQMTLALMKASRVIDLLGMLQEQLIAREEGSMSSTQGLLDPHYLLTVIEIVTVVAFASIG
ncbi:hypothetical protein ACLOJK_001248 [Asimina triloba]